MDLSLDTGSEALRTYLIHLRGLLSITQADMASALGMSRRAYSDLETGKSETRTVHILAAERLTLRAAMLSENPALLAKGVEQEVRSVAARL